MKITKNYLKQLIKETIAADRQVRFKNKKENRSYAGLSDSDINAILDAEDQIRDLTNKSTGKLSPEAAVTLKSKYAKYANYLSFPS